MLRTFLMRISNTHPDLILLILITGLTTLPIPRFILAVLLLPALAFAAEQQGSSMREALRGQVFDEASKALARANEVSASVLTPETYRSAAQSYQKAHTAFDTQADLDRVRSMLSDAAERFDQAAETAPIVLTVVSDAYEARLDAMKAEAQTRSPALWLKAEQALYEATSRAEKGRESRVTRYSQSARELFRSAELEAIENTLFTEIENQIQKAHKLNADDWAPKSYEFAVDLLSQARSEINSNRHDTDLPRDLVNQALHHAKHALYIARLADDIDDNDTSLEDVLMEWEGHIRALAADIDQPVYFDDGPAQSFEQLRAVVAGLDQKRAVAEQTLAESNRNAELLQNELLKVGAALEGQELAKERVDKRLAEQERRAQKFQRVEGLFTADEAQVVRKQNQLIIRLVGLNFRSGSAGIETRHYALLAKVQQALAEFPEVPITIEGHTDSHGMDSNNLQLSVKRADAVVSYLLANMPISPTRLSAVGYGEERPIANNETDEGRQRNRRIDVVLYP
ncbi:MAG: OmpA family protein [Proteobacteria bacterium]|nr:OmpA family protein [Pseudomonadota bacterium]